MAHEKEKWKVRIDYEKSEQEQRNETWVNTMKLEAGILTKAI